MVVRIREPTLYRLRRGGIRGKRDRILARSVFLGPTGIDNFPEKKEPRKET